MTSSAGTESPTRKDPTSTTPAQRAPSGDAAVARSPLVDEYGRTSVNSVVVRKIAGVATREVRGVHELGTTSARTVGAMRQRIPGSSGPNAAQGVSVEVGEREAAVDLDVVVEFGAPIHKVAEEIRANVIRNIERFTGLRVIEVNVAVDDVYVPQDDTSAPSRVQ